MEIYLNYYSTPLWFGFLQAWIFGLLLWKRAYQNNRLSDFLLGWVLVGMSLNIMEYMFGFSGIEVLWKELYFFPRSLGMAFAPICYFYFKSQIDQQFRFSKRDLLYFLPFLVHTFYHVGVFVLGPGAVKTVEENFHHPYYIYNLETILETGIDLYFIIKCLKLYQHYREWTKTQFSDPEAVSFKWFRNLLTVFVVLFVVYLLKLVLGRFIELDFKEDWWDNLIGVVLIYYVSITGYIQVQPKKGLVFKEEELENAPIVKEKMGTTEMLVWKEKILKLMLEDEIYLQPELSLAEIADRLKTNSSLLSGVINGSFGKNFNEFVNEFRVKEFERRIHLPENKNMSLLGIAFDCGFNSKATFNRAIKKHTGKSPKELLPSKV